MLLFCPRTSEKFYYFPKNSKTMSSQTFLKPAMYSLIFKAKNEEQQQQKYINFLGTHI